MLDVQRLRLRCLGIGGIRMTRAELFFRTNAGYSYDPATETEELGRWRTARELAAAETYAKAHGWTYEWGEDWADTPPEDVWNSEYSEYCLLLVDGEQKQSLCGIWDATPEYRRVIEAELALEEMPLEDLDVRSK